MNPKCFCPNILLDLSQIMFIGMVWNDNLDATTKTNTVLIPSEINLVLHQNGVDPFPYSQIIELFFLSSSLPWYLQGWVTVCHNFSVSRSANSASFLPFCHKTKYLQQIVCSASQFTNYLQLSSTKYWNLHQQAIISLKITTRLVWYSRITLVWEFQSHLPQKEQSKIVGHFCN